MEFLQSSLSIMGIVRKFLWIVGVPSKILQEGLLTIPTWSCEPSLPEDVIFWDQGFGGDLAVRLRTQV